MQFAWVRLLAAVLVCLLIVGHGRGPLHVALLVTSLVGVALTAFAVIWKWRTNPRTTTGHSPR